MNEVNLLEEFIKDDNWFENIGKYVELVKDKEVSQTIKNWIVNKYRGKFIHENAQVDDKAIIEGLAVIDKGAIIMSGVVIKGPVYIGKHAKIGPNCFIHDGVYVGRNSTIGQGVEIKGSILIDSVRMYHYGYIGNSIIGKEVNIGAGFVAAVRRFDGGDVIFRTKEGDIRVGKKGGCIIGDISQIGVDVFILPGRIISSNCLVYPGQIVRKNVLGTEMRIDYDDTEKKNVDKWSALLQIWDKEADRFWMRSNVFLTVNGALIIFTTSFSTTPLITSLIAVFGIILSTIWANVNQVGKYYLDRWKVPIKNIEKYWSIKPVHIIDKMSGEHPIPKKYKSSTKYMIYIIRLITIFWVLLLIISVLNGYINGF